ncbi:MAG: alpha/beta fold hydrolase [Eubacteriales bacterium]|nr:alpha/beta fold hydrolase [Eubacteriales bacterium]
MEAILSKYFDINDGGFSIRCKLYHKDKDLTGIRRVVIFGHGLGGHRDNKAAEKFAARVITKYKGIGVVTFDWPCHGSDARNKLMLSDCNAYLSLVIAYVRKRFDTDELYAYATSFGGYLTLKYIHENGNPFRRIALRCPAVNMYESMLNRVVKSDELDKLNKGKDVLVGFDRKVKINKEFLDSLKANDIRELDFMDHADDIFIIHGTKDEIIPIAEVARFADNNVIEFKAVENADHRFTDPKLMDEAILHITQFFDFR